MKAATVAISFILVLGGGLAYYVIGGRFGQPAADGQRRMEHGAAAAAIAADAAPAVGKALSLLFSRKGEWAIGTIDVQPEFERLVSLPLEKRRSSMARSALELCLDQMSTNSKLQETTLVRLYVVRITSHDEYARGDMQGMIRVGTIETSRALLGRNELPLVERVTAVHWNETP